jgi:hypothetical protein
MKWFGVVCVCVWSMGCLPTPTSVGPGVDASGDVGADASGDAQVADTGDASDASGGGGVGVCGRCEGALSCGRGEVCGPGACLSECDDDVCRAGSWDISEFDPAADVTARTRRYYGQEVALSADGRTAVATTGAGFMGRSLVTVRDACGLEQALYVTTQDAVGSETDLGGGLALSGDGLVLAIGEGQWSTGATTNAGRVFIYRRDALGEEFEGPPVVLRRTTARAEERFGSELALSPTGDTLLVVSLNPTPSSDPGQVSAWSLASEVPVFVGSASGGEEVALFGRGLSVSWSASVAVVGAPRSDELRGGVYVIDFAGGWDSPPVTLLPYDEVLLQPKATIEVDGEEVDVPGSMLGHDVSISPDGAYIAAGAPGTSQAQGGGEVSKRGQVFVWQRVRLPDVYEEARVWQSAAEVGASLGGSVVVTDRGQVWAGAADYGVPVDEALGVEPVRDYARPGGLFKIDGAERPRGDETRLVREVAFAGDYDAHATTKLGWSLDISSDGAVLLSGAQTSDVGGVTEAGSVVVFRAAAGAPE